MGRVVKYTSGRPVPDVEISVIRPVSPGVVDSVVTSTDGSGFFQVAANPGSDSLATFDLLVRPAGLPAYRILGLTAPVATARGEAHAVGQIMNQAFLTARFVSNQRCRTPPWKTPVNAVARRVSGPSLTPVVDGTPGFSIPLSEAGEAVLPLGAIAVDTVTTLVATAHTTVDGRRLVAGFQLDPMFLFQQRPEVILAFAPESMYIGCIRHRGSSVPLAGITIDFTRTGGATTIRQSATVTSDSAGVFLLNLGPLGRGDVTGDLTVHGFEASTTYVVRSVTLPASDSFLAEKVFGVGLHLPYFGTVHRFNTAQAGVRVTLKRTGGIAATPDSITMVTGSNGRFDVVPFGVKDHGEIVLDIIVTPPAPATPFVVSGVRLRAVDGDSQGIHFISIDLNNPPSS